MTDRPASGAPERAHSDFDPQVWLDKFESCGGWLQFDEQGNAATHCSVMRNTLPNQYKAADMLREISDQQMKKVIEVRKAEATRFKPAIWCVEFNAVGGSVFAMAGQPWTGVPEQADDRAHMMRRRLIPEEVAKLRSFLRRHLDLEMKP